MKYSFQLLNLLIKNGSSSIAELKRDYENSIGDGWLPDTPKEIREILQTIPDICMVKNRNGTDLWMAKQAIKDNLGEHLIKSEVNRKRKSTTMIKEEVPQKRQRFEPHTGVKNDYGMCKVPAIDLHVPMVRTITLILQ